MHTWISNRAYTLFMKIAEPRVIRIILFAVYGVMTAAGASIVLQPPSTFAAVLGTSLVYILGSFVAFGSLASMIAVLPGIWWFERVGIIAIITGMGIYTVGLCALGRTPLSVLTTIAFALLFAVRWQEIRRFQLAPLEPKES